MARAVGGHQTKAVGTSEAREGCRALSTAHSLRRPSRSQVMFQVHLVSQGLLFRFANTPSACHAIMPTRWTAGNTSRCI